MNRLRPTPFDPLFDWGSLEAKVETQLHNHHDDVQLENEFKHGSCKAVSLKQVRLRFIGQLQKRLLRKRQQRERNTLQPKTCENEKPTIKHLRGGGAASDPAVAEPPCVKRMRLYKQPETALRQQSPESKPVEGKQIVEVRSDQEKAKVQRKLAFFLALALQMQLRLLFVVAQAKAEITKLVSKRR